MKLTTKHLAAYLPYGLKIKTNNTIREMFYDLSKDVTGSKYTSIANILNGIGHKPILRPLSDLTKEIEVNGEKFVPIKEFYNRSLLNIPNIITVDENDVSMFIQWEFKDGTTGYDVIYKNHILKSINANFYEMLIEWHFDIYGLIENDLAISIHNVAEAGI
jgi:hypothetical protein